MSVVQVDQKEVTSAIKEVATQTSELIRLVPNMGTPTRGLQWTVGETAAHILSAVRAHSAWAVGAGIPLAFEEIATSNARSIEEITERDAPRLADMLMESVNSFLDAAAHRSAQEPFTWYGDHSLEFPLEMCILLGELVVHGYDIARSTHNPWAINRRHAGLVMSGVAAVLPLYINPETAADVKAAYEIRIRKGPRFITSFNQGKLTVEPSGSMPVDCYIWADPVAFMLVGYGRVGQWGPILKGQIMSWGRKPWLGFNFSKFLLRP